jgi:hypothetical protein
MKKQEKKPPAQLRQKAKPKKDFAGNTQATRGGVLHRHRGGTRFDPPLSFLVAHPDLLSSLNSPHPTPLFSSTTAASVFLHKPNLPPQFHPASFSHGEGVCLLRQVRRYGPPPLLVPSLVLACFYVVC